MAIREGRWDCPSCGSTGIYGRHVDCPGCNKPRPAGIRFYLSDDAPVVTDPARLREARAGADWVCEHCGASNRATEDNCTGCGAELGGSAEQPVRDYEMGDVPRSGTPDAPGEGARRLGLSGAGGGGGGGKKVLQGCGGCGCLVLVVSMLMTAVGALLGPPVGGTDLVPAVVESRRWERTVVVEQRRVVDGEGWELPDSARVVRQRRRVHHNDEEIVGYRSRTREVPRTERVRDGVETRTRQVEERVRTGTREYVCGQRDLGNGYFEDIECEEPVYETRTRTERYEEPSYREVTTYETVTEDVPVTRPRPVYQTYYTWRVPRWEVVDTLRAQGANPPPAWPDTTLRRGQRIASRREQYTLTLRDVSGARRTLELGVLQWSGWRPGERVALSRDAADLSTILPADSLYDCRRWHRDRKYPPPDSLGCSPLPREPARR